MCYDIKTGRGWKEFERLAIRYIGYLSVMNYEAAQIRKTALVEVC